MTSKPVPRFNANSPRFIAALSLAAELHAAQTRKETDIPYIAHLLGVASIAIEYGASEDEAIAGLLHDAAEDQGGKDTLEKIRALFGDAVAHIVDSCTDAYASHGEEKPEWTLRKANYIAHLRHTSPAVRLVSAADKLHNARSILMDYRQIGEAVFDRFKKKTVYHTLWYYRRLADVFLEIEPNNPLMQELDRVVTEIERAVIATRSKNEIEKERVYNELDVLVSARLDIKSMSH
jgi:(p)ppGpp synthase/HD superfamily hydrolase